MMEKTDDEIDNISSSSSQEEDVSAEVLRINEYRQNIQINSEDYESHFLLIKALRVSGDNAGARAAREEMNSHFPLSSEMWLEWIKDERQNDSSNIFINKLFGRSIEDYQSIDLWCEYCQFAIDNFNDKEVVRELFEDAVGQVGSQFDKGYMIWNIWMIYEKEVLMENLEGELAEEQRQRVYILYLRQLSLPLKYNKESFDEFLEWNSEWKYPEDEIKTKFDASIKTMDLYRPFEKALSDAAVYYSSNKTETETSSQEESWLLYLRFADGNMDKMDVVNLYERAITSLRLSQEIWRHYIRFLLKTFESHYDRILDTCQRAIRNNKSNLELRLFLVWQMEKFSCEVDEIRDTFNSIFQEQILDANKFLIISKAYADFERRQIDKSEHRDLTVIRFVLGWLIAGEQYLVFDPTCSLMKYWAFIEAFYEKNLEKSRELWTMVRNHLGNGRTALWLENFEFERRFGDYESCKGLMSDALKSSTDFPEYLLEKILRWAAEEGDIDDYFLFAFPTQQLISLRNNNSDLWKRLQKMRAAEIISPRMDKIRATFESILKDEIMDANTSLILWQRYIDFERRQLDKSPHRDLTVIRGLFERSIAFTYYQDFRYDPTCGLIKYWAFIEAHYRNNLEKCRELWTMVRKHLGNGCTELWLENLEFERRFCDFESCKRLMSNAVISFTGNTDYLFPKILRWAAEEGNIDDYLLFIKMMHEVEDVAAQWGPLDLTPDEYAAIRHAARHIATSHEIIKESMIANQTIVNLVNRYKSDAKEQQTDLELLRRHSKVHFHVGPCAPELTHLERVHNEAAAQVCRYVPELLFYDDQRYEWALAAVKRSGLFC